MDPIVDIRGLGFSYGRLPVLRGIDLSIERGSVLGIIGPNGGGKTTLLRLMLGLLKPDTGSIRIAGKTPRQAKREGNCIGYLPQNAQVNPQLPITLRQLVRLGLAGKTGILQTAAPADIEFVEELLEQVGLQSVAGRAIGEVSGGQLQRAMIARAIAPRPALLLLDEPTIGIDRRGQQEFTTLIEQLRNRYGLTTVLISHDLRAVTGLSDRIACLAQTVHYHDTPRHVPADLVYQMFACDLQALGVGSVCHEPACEGNHAPGDSVAPVYTRSPAFDD